MAVTFQSSGRCGSGSFAHVHGRLIMIGFGKEVLKVEADVKDGRGAKD